MVRWFMTFSRFAEGPSVFGQIAVGLIEGRIRYVYGDRSLNVQLAREESTERWLASVEQVPGAMAYAETREGAARAAVSVALRALADAVEEPERLPGLHALSSQLMSSAFRFENG
jgi:predicted RNase H-like HicB family nuclease